jgi:hypothetical protein
VAKRGRPRTTFNEANVTKILELLEKYTEETNIPILAEFAYKNHVLREDLYKYAEFDSAIKRLINKKEAQLERECLNGNIDRTMAVFSLKQLGWKDQHSEFNLPKGKKLIITDSE